MKIMYVSTVQVWKHFKQISRFFSR